MNQDESFITQLEQLAENSQPDSLFVDNLENQLRSVHMEMKPEKTNILSRFYKTSDSQKTKRKGKPSSPMRWLAAIFALVIIGGLFLTIPPLRDTTQAVMDYFYPPELAFFYPTYDNPLPTDKTEPFRGIRFYKTDSLEQAYEEIYGSEFLVLPEQEGIGGIGISHISASREALIVVYLVQSDQEADYPAVISLYQLKLPDGLPIPMAVPAEDFEQEIVRVNGSAGAYVQSGVWSFFIPQFGSNGLQNGAQYLQIGNAHRLAWQEGDIVYILTMTEYLADSGDDVVAVAESLVPYQPETDS